MKLITTQYAPKLNKGDIIFKHPYNSNPEQLKDGGPANNTQTYQIRSINEKSGMLELVMNDASQTLFARAGDVSRIFINVRHLAEQKVWWLNDDH